MVVGRVVVGAFVVVVGLVVVGAVVVVEGLVVVGCFVVVGGRVVVGAFVVDGGRVVVGCLVVGALVVAFTVVAGLIVVAEDMVVTTSNHVTRNVQVAILPLESVALTSISMPLKLVQKSNNPPDDGYDSILTSTPLSSIAVGVGYTTNTKQSVPDRSGATSCT